MPDLEDGESVEMQGSAKTPYLIKNTGGVYSCSCPAWRNQSVAIEQRTCKHIRKLRGDAAEQERVGSALPAKKASAEKAAGPPLLLAHRWENEADLTDWWMSEKLDGVRAYWDGKRFLSRQGNPFHAPDWFLDGLPETPLDGELWLDRKAFQRTVSIVRRQDKSDHWKQIRYVVFDAPSLKEPFESRLEFLADCQKSIPSGFVSTLKHARCRSLDHLREELARIEQLGGEGLMLRQPGSSYEAGRSTTLLKVKSFRDEEAVVVDYVKGKGRHKGRLGALVVRLQNGTQFCVGTGFTDKQRENPPAIGSLITFRYQELSDGGVPRFPSFVRPRGDLPAAVISLNDTKQAPPKKTSPPNKILPTATEVRYFEFQDGKSSKFWEIRMAGTEVITRHGKIGSEGRETPKSFADPDAAQDFMAKQIRQKTDKGYVETQPG
jgi:DNA ligase 1